ncbi:MAG: response regulator [Elusimicrobia bacterium]|nr:response regulator [Elusimicrobiota bacterium]
MLQNKESDYAPKAPAACVAPAPSRRRVNILLVDDHEENLLALETVLADQGYHLVKAHSGEEALRHLLKEDFALIIIDVHMPKMDGFETASLIRRRENSRHTPIIFMTGISMGEMQVQKGYMVGAVDYIFKPFIGEILRAKVAVFVELFNKAEQIREQAEQLRQIESRQHQQEIARIQDQRNRFFYLALEMMGIVGFDGLIQEVNASWEKATGFSTAELAGRTFLDFVHPDDHAAMKEHWRQLTTYSEHTLAFENRFKAKDGSYRWLLWSCVAVPGEKVFYAAAREIEEHKRLERELIKARDAALESVRVKSDFVANISHEIRTPMNVMMGMAGLLLDTKLTSEQRQYSEMVREHCDLLLSIIDDILDFSKLESGKMALEIKDFDPRGVVESVAELLAPRAQLKGLELVAWADPDVPSVLLGDASRLRQVLINLGGNAIKFTETGEVVIHVSNKQETDTHAHLRFSIRDTGIGISPQQRQGLFKPFTQADTSLTRKFGGTGLGLAFSKRLMDLMGGAIGVDSALGQGSTFFVDLAFEKQAAAGQRPVPAAALSNVRVLIIDDNASARRALIEQMNQWNMRAEGVAGEEEGLSLSAKATAAGDPYGFCLIDSRIPGVDSLALAAKIKKGLPAIKLVLMTNLIQSVDLKEMHSAGIDRSISKPVSQAALFASLGSGRNGLGPAAAAAGAKRASKTKGHKIRVLVAEDHSVNRRMMQIQLKKLGYESDVVADGKEAIEATGRFPYRLVLMDCQMPEMDGYRAATAIRKREQGSVRIPIVGVTAHAMPGDREKCLAAGMDDYISKPVTMEKLVGILDKWVDGGGRPEVTVRLPEGIDDPKLVAELIALYLNKTPQYINDLKKAYSEKSAKAVAAAAHAMRGSSLNLGLDAMAEICRRIEESAGSRRLAGLDKQLAALDEEFERIRQCLKKPQGGKSHESSRR